MKYLDHGKLSILMKAELQRHGASPDSAAHVAASLIQTSLRGVDSHGINLFPHYCRAVAAGRVNGRPTISVSRTGASAGIIDSDHAFGHHSGAVAMENAISLAAETGVGAVSVRNSTHFGAAAYFGLMAAERGYLGFAFTNADALVKAAGSREAFFGTNPICFTAPLEGESPFCLDMATSLVSWNKIANFRRENLDIPAGWAFDAAGETTTDPHAAVSLNPAGGYKGFGLGMMVDILCALLANGPVSKDIMPMYHPPLDDRKRCISHFFMAVDIVRFTDPGNFRATLKSVVERIRCLPSDGYGEQVMVPGDPEKRSHAARIAGGIPVDDAKFQEFLDISADFKDVVRI